MFIYMLLNDTSFNIGFGFGCQSTLVCAFPCKCHIVLQIKKIQHIPQEMHIKYNVVGAGLCDLMVKVVRDENILLSLLKWLANVACKCKELYYVEYDFYL